LTLDLICQVIDNYGDVAVSWRLAQALVEDGGPDLRVRLLVDDIAAFRALCPGDTGAVTVMAWADLEANPPDVLVEAFGAPTPHDHLEAFYARGGVLIHLEYLTAEAWSERYHLLPSPLGRPGVERFFFVPGFRANTGGLVFTDAAPALANPPWQPATEDLVISVFSYEHNFAHLWDDLADWTRDTGKTARVRVCEGRQRDGCLASLAAVCARRGVPELPGVTVELLPFLDQNSYTALVNASDFNVVRGEESWVVALLSGKPFLWHAYLQDEGHQLVKVKAFLEVLEPHFDGDAQRVFAGVAHEFRQFNDRLANSAAEPPYEHYRVFWDNRVLLERVQRKWAAELRNSAKLSRRLLDFLGGFRV